MLTCDNKKKNKRINSKERKPDLKYLNLEQILKNFVYPDLHYNYHIINCVKRSHHEKMRAKVEKV